MDWAIDGNKISFFGNHEVVLPFAVKQAIEVAGVLVVVLDVPADKSMTENVFGIAKSGQKLWQVERIQSTASDPNNVYVSVNEPSGDTVSITNWNGMIVTIDTQTGQVKNQRFGK